MAGGKSTPKKDRAVKVSSGMLVKTGQILTRGLPGYKAGVNVKGMDTLYALCPGKIYFSKKKTSHGKFRTFVNITPAPEKA
jgi:ribosomal protein L27